jgi:hypothetical protein
VEIWSGLAGPEAQRRLLRTTAFADLARSSTAAYAAGVDLDGDGRIDRIMATQGDGGGSVGVRSLTSAGAMTGTFGAVPQNLRIATSTLRRPVRR